MKSNSSVFSSSSLFRFESGWVGTLEIKKSLPQVKVKTGTLSCCSYKSKLFSRKTYTNSGWNATIARHWKDSFQRRNILPKIKTIFKGRWKVCVIFQTDTDKLNIVVYFYRNNLYLKDNEVDLKLTEYQSFLAKRYYLLSYIDIFYKQCILLDKTTVHN